MKQGEGTAPDGARVRAERPLGRYALELIAVGGAYYVAAVLSLELSLVGDSVTPLWPPSGIALVGFLLFGYRLLPAVAAAAFLVNLPISPTPEAAAWIAAGNTLAPGIAAALLRIARFRPALDRTRDAVALVALGALGGMTISATIGTSALERSGAIAADQFWSTWAVWWAGDAMGVLAVTPFLLSVRAARTSRARASFNVAEVVLTFGALGYTALLLNVTSRPVWVAVFPLLVWIAWRFQQRGAGIASLLVIASASWAAAHDAGPFMGTELIPKMVALQVFNAAVSLTSFFFAAVVAERIAAREELERSAAELYQREHRIAETLQRSLLPDALPDLPDLEVAARYVPATGYVEVGGDWYDIIPLPTGLLGIAIGDVAGHGIAAAAAMGQIRMALRVYALEGLAPATALARLNALILELNPGAMATLVYGYLDPATGALTLAKAGHPSPLIVHPDGRTEFIGGGLAPPLGVSPIVEFKETSVELGPGSTLLLYTDGLVERRGISIDDGMDRLARAALGAPADLESVTDHFVATMIGDEAPDDAAILAIRRVDLTREPLSMVLPANPSKLAHMRRVVGRWLQSNGVDAAVVRDVLIACTEACANAIQHAYGSREGVMEVAAVLSEGALTVSVRDFGAWRAPSDDGQAGGRGLTLMRGLMDGVEVITDIEGTEVRMTRAVGSMVTHA